MTTPKGTWTVLCLAFATLSAIFTEAAEAQQIVTPTKVTADAFLDQASDPVRCGIHWANILLQGKEILAYQINIEGWFLTDTKQSTTAVWASLRTTTVKGDQTTHVDTPPSDIYLFIQQDPTMYRIGPAPGAFPNNWYGGAIDVGGIKGNSDKALAPTLAMLKNIPMLVYLVFDLPTGKKTLAFNTVNNLRNDQDTALTDCLVRGVKRASP
jgi:hypothetical protein